MQIRAICGTCSRETPVEVEREFRDDNFYEMTCPDGHVNLFHIQAPKFELIFHLGVLALADGYAREAVASFATAVDVFFEFAIRVLLRRRGVGGNAIEEARKLWARQSERQLGAFAALYLLETGHPFEYLPSNAVTFRNDVTHKGYLPSKAEAIRYGQQGVDFFFRALRVMFRDPRRDDFRHDIVSDFTARRVEYRNAKKTYHSQGGCTFQTALNLYVEPFDQPPPKLSEYLDRLEAGIAQRHVFRR